MAAPTYVASYSPASDWTTATTPKTDSVTANNGDVLVMFGGTENGSSLTLGTPSDGTNTYTLQQSESVANLCGSYAWTTIVGASAPLSVTTSSLPDATDGTAYTATLNATGGTSTGYLWTVSAGVLPVWATLVSSTGVISGTPSGTGTDTFTVKVTDSSFNTATQTLSITTSGSAGIQPTGPSGTWTLAWNDEFNDTPGMSGHTTGLNASKWNVGFYFGPSSPGGAGYAGKSKTASNGAGAVEFYGPNALIFPSGGGMEMHCYAPGSGPDGSYSISGFSSTSESGMVNTAGIMCFTTNTSYSVPSAIASTVIQAANIVVEVEAQWAGPDYIAGSGLTNGGYWQWIGTYNCGDCSTPNYPNSGQWTEEMDLWESFRSNGSTGGDFYCTFHQASSFGSTISCPGSVSATDLSLAAHKYTVQWTGTSMALWVDGTQVTGVSPSSSEVSNQFATPQYLGIALQLISGYVATGASSGGHGPATPLIISYVRLFTQ